MSAALLLTSAQVASFVARGFLRFDAAVPEAINTQFLAEAGSAEGDVAPRRRDVLRALAANDIPEIAAGTPLSEAYPAGSAVARLLDLPLVKGVIASLLGESPVFDHHFLHVTLPPRFYEGANAENVSQHTHQDSTVDPSLSFDVQLMYFPHAVSRAMGGTRFIPGSHLHKVSEVALARYQNLRGQQHMVCPAGTLLFLHHGLWHGGGVNHAETPRYMLKIRMHAGGAQTRRWDISDLAPPGPQRPIFFLKSAVEPDSIETILTTPEPWFEADTARLEYVNRIKLWRYLADDPGFDADYWLSRFERRPRAMA